MGGGTQLLVGSSVRLSTMGQLTVCLAAFRHGEALLRVVLEDDGGTERGGQNASSQNLTIRVLPVKSAPFFAVSQREVRLDEDSTLAVPGFALNVSPGGWGEEAQSLHFTVEQVRALLEQRENERCLTRSARNLKAVYWR